MHPTPCSPPSEATTSKFTTINFHHSRASKGREKSPPFNLKRDGIEGREILNQARRFSPLYTWLHQQKPFTPKSAPLVTPQQPHLHTKKKSKKKTKNKTKPASPKNQHIAASNPPPISGSKRPAQPDPGSLNHENGSTSRSRGLPSIQSMSELFIPCHPRFV